MPSLISKLPWVGRRSDRRDTGVVNYPHERFVDGVGMDCVAFAVGEHPPFAVGDADRNELRGLERPPTGQDHQGRVVERDGAASGLCLPLVSWTSYPTATRPRLRWRRCLVKSMSGDLSPSTSLRRIPVIAANQYNGNNR